MVYVKCTAHESPLDKKKSVKNNTRYMWLSKEDCISNVKRPQLRYLLTNTSLHQLVEAFFTWALLFLSRYLISPREYFSFRKWFIEKALSYCRLLLTFRSTQKRNWTFFLPVITRKRRQVYSERKAPKLDADSSWWLINLLADTAGLDLCLNTDVFIFLFCISVFLSAEGTRLYIWPEYCGASFMSRFTAGL